MQNVSQNITVANRQMEPSILDSSGVNRWGAIPGTFDATYTTKIQIQEFDKVTT
jgi:hypothetical protein